ncbi:hypothetical protein, variant [Aphanomyces invadans]|nr:hypothetical protein, variant [Aphanomyces invadans]ETV91817.1 hypothetical protein, variant [Aphanomyces invadans]|eukprot:XP_008879454.1 hypothetical protein, variant [Aphanomyces invadans]
MIVLADLLAHIAQVHIAGNRRQKQQHAVWVPPTQKTSLPPNLTRVPSHHVIPAQVDDKSSPWINMNLGQPKATRIIRHPREVHPSTDGNDVHVSDTLPPSRHVQREAASQRSTLPTQNGPTSIEDVPTHKDTLNTTRSDHDIDSGKRRMWYNNQHDAHNGTDDDDDDMYPRASIHVRRTPSIDKAQIPSPPRPTNASYTSTPPPDSSSDPPTSSATSHDAVLQALLHLEENVASKLDALSRAFDEKLAALDNRVARLETVQSAMAMHFTPSAPSLATCQGSPNQENPADALPTPPRVKLSSFLTQSVDRQYKWPPEPSVFGHQSRP